MVRLEQETTLQRAKKYYVEPVKVPRSNHIPKKIMKSYMLLLDNLFPL